MKSENRLRIAIQKSGNLSEGSIDLLKKSGLKLQNGKPRKLIFHAKEMPVDIMSVRDDDIPTLVSENVCDIGIVGENVFMESYLQDSGSVNTEIRARLGFSRCRLSIAVPGVMEYKGTSCLNGLNIATSYPMIVGKFLGDKGADSHIVKMEGSVEVAPQLKISDVICDLVSSGSTLEAHSLKEAEVVLQSEAVLIQRKDILQDEQRSLILDKLMQRINGVISARDSKYVMLNSPKDKIQEITNLLPGNDSPTIMPLADSNKVAVHAVCSEPVFWDTMEKLKAVGATSILVMPIEKMLN